MSGHSLTRRAFLGSSIALAAQAPTKPNILLLLADNWAFPHASIYGDPVLHTPTFDRLASEGLLFKSAFAPNPSCSPSRSSLLTGQETHRLGEAASLYGPLEPHHVTYVDLLEKAGYFCGFSGKGWGPGSSENRKENPAGRQFKDFHAFLAAKPAGAPFCFWFGSHDPHVPWNRGQERKARFDKSKVVVPAHLPNGDVVREDILSYYAEVETFDSECAELLTFVDMDKTVVVMTSDNGWQMPRGLGNCYDLGVRIPLTIRFPNKQHTGVREDFVSIADLAPTFLDAARVKKPAAMTASSLLSSRPADHIFLERERHANVRKGDLSYPVRGIRTRDFLYLRNFEPDRWPAGDPEFYWAVGSYGDVDDSPTKQLLLREKPQPYFDLTLGKRPTEELFDLRNDPGQVRNVASEPAYAKQRRELAGRVDSWMKATGDPRAAKGRTEFWDKAPYTGPNFKGTPK